MAKWSDYFKGMEGVSCDNAAIDAMTELLDGRGFYPSDYNYKLPEGVNISTYFINREANFMNSVWGGYPEHTGYYYTPEGDDPWEFLPFADISACPSFPIDKNGNLCRVNASLIKSAATYENDGAKITTDYLTYTPNGTNTYIRKVVLASTGDTLLIDNGSDCTNCTLNETQKPLSSDGKKHRCILIEVVAKGGNGAEGVRFTTATNGANNSAAGGGGGGSGAYIRFAVNPLFAQVKITRNTSNTTVAVSNDNGNTWKTVTLGDGKDGIQGSATNGQWGTGGTGGAGGDGGYLTPSTVPAYNYFGEYACVLFASKGVAGGAGGDADKSGTNSAEIGYFPSTYLDANFAIVNGAKATASQIYLADSIVYSHPGFSVTGTYASRGGAGGPTWLGQCSEPNTTHLYAECGAGGWGGGASLSEYQKPGNGGHSAVLIHYIDPALAYDYS